MKQILSVSYDPVLLQTRHLLLEQSGYKVASVEGVTSALAACHAQRYDLLIVGHSIAHRDKQEIVSEFKRMWGAPVLVLLRVNEPKLREADFSMDASDGPAALLNSVASILGSRAAAG
jgi:DNA-binding response OmpR family regulator